MRSSVRDGATATVAAQEDGGLSRRWRPKRDPPGLVLGWTVDEDQVHRIAGFTSSSALPRT
ncbi:hypothetical protein [Candidatus Palauibacter soopunensis]|uniref:hypothetical protein n=1 Tax=Candidatus Palauibacter soopunensis TaxID=3056739 RepID=UPI0028731EC0|nr:hypothetical protein [Candidatus Palauibacter soopunensis]